jgi:hypothetical protein
MSKVDVTYSGVEFSLSAIDEDLDLDVLLSWTYSSD